MVPLVRVAVISGDSLPVFIEQTQTVHGRCVAGAGGLLVPLACLAVILADSPAVLIFARKTWMLSSINTFPRRLDAAPTHLTFSQRSGQ